MQAKDLMMEAVEKVWQDLGFKIRAKKNTVVFVKTEPPEEMVGRILIPESVRSFYSAMPHQRVIKALVLAAGKYADVQPGEYVHFQRLFFLRGWSLTPHEHVGWVDANDIQYQLED